MGRTGRAGNTGEAISLFTRNDWRHAEELIKILEEAEQNVPDGLVKMARRFKERKPSMGRGGRGGGRGGGGFRRGGRGRDDFGGFY